MIAAARADGVFVNETSDDTVQLRHVQSGMVCRFIPAAQGNIVQVEAGKGRGDKVTCNTLVSGIATTLSVSRNTERQTVDQAAQAWAASMRDQFPDAAPAGGEPAHFKAEEPPPAAARQVRVDFTMNGLSLYMRAAVAICGPWLVEESSTTRRVDAQLADVTGEAALFRATRAVCAANRRGAG